MPVLLGISQRSFNPAWSTASFEAEFYKIHSHIYLFSENEQPVAYLIIWDLKEEGEIVSLAVDKGWRNKGIGTKLLSFVFDTHPVKAWSLEVDPDNGAAISLYEKHKFKRCRVIKDYYGQGKDAVQMTRKL